MYRCSPAPITQAMSSWSVTTIVHVLPSSAEYNCIQKPVDVCPCLIGSSSCLFHRYSDIASCDPHRVFPICAFTVLDIPSTSATISAKAEASSTSMVTPRRSQTSFAFPHRSLPTYRVTAQYQPSSAHAQRLCTARSNPQSAPSPWR